MSNSEILKKTIEKAIKNGWEGEKPWCQECVEDWYKMIFSHDFAKAFWGEEDWYKIPPILGWKYHLQQMVLEEDPILYLEKFLEDTGQK